MVEEDLQRIGRWVAQQCEGMHTRLARLLTNSSDTSYPVDYLRGAQHMACMARASSRLSPPVARPQSKLTS